MCEQPCRLVQVLEAAEKGQIVSGWSRNCRAMTPTSRPSDRSRSTNRVESLRATRTVRCFSANAGGNVDPRRVRRQAEQLDRIVRRRQRCREERDAVQGFEPRVQERGRRDVAHAEHHVLRRAIVRRGLARADVGTRNKPGEATLRVA